MVANGTKPARAGRERTCTQCGAVYRSPRSTSRFCSPACRKKAARGTAPTGGPKAGPAGWSYITKALVLCDFVGLIGPANARSSAPPEYGLLVPFERALDELSYQFNRKGFGYVGRDEFGEALKRDGIRSFSARTAEGAEQNRYLTRQRQRIERAS